MKKEDLDRLCKLEERIHEIAKDSGLLTTEIIFELVSPKRMIEAMSYHFPTNFSHWTFGRDYEHNRTIYENTGVGIPYEVVWNFDVPRAFLVDTNPFTLNVLTIAHVYGHVDFFLRNKFLQKGRLTADIAHDAREANKRFQEYESKFGKEAVEAVIDAGLSIVKQQDPDPFAEDISEKELRTQLIELEREKLRRAKDLKSELGKQKTHEEIKEIEKKLGILRYKTPPIPEHDILKYIIDNSPKPLREWEKDILSIIRSQRRALAFNMRTKTLNEGWATYWHVRIMRQLFKEGLLTPEEHGVFNENHSAVLQENKKGFNWYRVGLSLYEYVEEKWDKGQFGDEYEDSKDPYKRVTWDTGAMKGREKVFEIATNYSDRMTVEQFFTDEFIRQEKLYIYEELEDSATGDIIYVIIEKRPKIIRQLLKNDLTLYHIPVIAVQDGNHNGNRELYLKHEPLYSNLDEVFETGTLEHIYFLWGKPLHLETKELGVNQSTGDIYVLHQILHSYNGKAHHIQVHS